MNPFLASCCRGTIPFFDLAYHLRTISIRDQMIRAMLLAEELPEWLQQEWQSIGESKQYPILVIGAGACGMTVAVLLAQHGYQVLVTESQPFNHPVQAFGRQHGCTTRWIDPTQYDWPLDHWQQSRFPWPGFAQRNPPFPWQADWADRIADQWLFDLTGYLQTINLSGQTNLSINYDVTPDLCNIRYTSNPPLIEIPLNQNGTTYYNKYCAVVWCGGPGQETGLIAKSGWRGFHFWETDPFEQHNCGLANSQTEGTVLISGAGDGALQDFLRIVTRRRSVRQIFEELDLDNHIDYRKIFSAELRAERGRNWCFGTKTPIGRISAHADQYQAELANVYNEIVNELLSDPYIRPRLQEITTHAPKNVKLVTRGDYFTCTYGLNHLLALLLIRGIGKPQIEWLSGHRVVDIVAPNGTTYPNLHHPQDCLGRPWQVQLLNGTNQWTIPAQVVVLRYGLSHQSHTQPQQSLPVHSLDDLPLPFPPFHLFP